MTSKSQNICGADKREKVIEKIAEHLVKYVGGQYFMREALAETIVDIYENEMNTGGLMR